MLNFALALLFFLPIIESFSRMTGYFVLISASLLLGLSLLRKKVINLNYISVLFFLTLFTFIPSLYTSWSLSRSFSEYLRYFAYFVIFLSVLNVENKSKVLKFIQNSILFNSIALSLFSYLYFIPFIKLPVPTNGMNLFYPNFGHNRLVILLIMAFPLSLHLFLTSKQKKYLLLTLFFLVTIFTTFGRGAIISLGVAISIYLYFIHRKKTAIGNEDAREKSVIYLFGLFGIVALILLLTVFLGSNFAKTADVGKTNWYKPAGNELRIEYWRQAIIGFSKYPLLGTGLDTFRYVSLKYQKEIGDSSWYVHNQFLELFSETGVAGGLSFSLLILAIFIYSFKFVRKHDKKGLNIGEVLLIIIISSIFHNFIDYDWQYHSIFLYFWMTSGILISFMDLRQIQIGRRIQLAFYVFFVILVFTRLVFILDTDKSISQAEKFLNKRDFTRALKILDKLYIEDYANALIPMKYADLYEYAKDYEMAHLWYQKGIERNFYGTKAQQAGDFLLYLKQARDALLKNDIALSLSFLNNGNIKYSYLVSEDEENQKYIDKLINFKETQNMELYNSTIIEYINYLEKKLHLLE